MILACEFNGRSFCMTRWGAFLLILAAVPGFAQQAPAKKANELVGGKLIYVAPMPDNLDQWILDFLHRWGKYKTTSNPEGVDLLMKGYTVEKETEWEMRGGVPQPREERRRFPVPGKGRKELPVISISVIDWVTNQPLWRADVLNRKQKKDEADPPLGPHTQIFARDLTPDQLAQKLTARLREYVSELEKTAGSKQ
jgi:hypothetical protein